jgi:carbohydrate-selective porin OprB
MSAALWTHTQTTRRTHRLNAAWQRQQALQAAQEARSGAQAANADCLTCPRTEECVARVWSECAFVMPTPPEMTPATLEEAGTYSPREELWRF